MPAVRARRSLADRVGAGPQLPVRAPPAPEQQHGLHPGWPAVRGPARASRRSPPLRGRLLPQPRFEDLAALAVTEAGKGPVDLRRDPGAVGAPDVEDVAAILALAAGVQPDPVVAAPVRAGRPLRQAPAGQPRVGAVDQGLAASAPRGAAHLLRPGTRPAGPAGGLRFVLELEQRIVAGVDGGRGGGRLYVVVGGSEHERLLPSRAFCSSVTAGGTGCPGVSCSPAGRCGPAGLLFSGAADGCGSGRGPARRGPAVGAPVRLGCGLLRPVPACGRGAAAPGWAGSWARRRSRQTRTSFTSSAVSSSRMVDGLPGGGPWGRGRPVRPGPGWRPARRAVSASAPVRRPRAGRRRGWRSRSVRRSASGRARPWSRRACMGAAAAWR